jgi:hypothetical protein
MWLVEVCGVKLVLQFFQVEHVATIQADTGVGQIHILREAVLTYQTFVLFTKLLLADSVAVSTSFDHWPHSYKLRNERGLELPSVGGRISGQKLLLDQSMLLGIERIIDIALVWSKEVMDQVIMLPEISRKFDISFLWQI